MAVETELVEMVIYFMKGYFGIFLGGKVWFLEWKKSIQFSNQSIGGQRQPDQKLELDL